MNRIPFAGRIFAICSGICVAIALSVAGNAVAQATDSGRTVVISQIYGGGGNAGASLTNDFIELHNRSSLPVDLTGWSVQYASGSGTTWQKTELTGIVQPGQYFLVMEGRGAGGSMALPLPDITGSINMSAASGKIALVNTNATLSGSCPAGTQIVDLVGYGTANCFTGNAPAPAATNTSSAQRAGAGCVDASSNDADFSIVTAQPRNSAAPALICAQLGGVLANCPTALATSAGQAVSAPLSAVDVDGLVSAASITSGAVAGISLINFVPASAAGASARATLSVDATTASGRYGVQIAFSNNDPQPQSGTCTVQISVAATTPGNVRIHDIQGRSHLSPLSGQSINDVPGVVTALRGNGFYLQDPVSDSDPATSEAIFVFTNAAPTVAVGDSVLVSGLVQEFRPGGASSSNLTQTEIANPTLNVLSHDNGLPAPVIIGSGGRIPPSQSIKAGDCVDVEQGTCTFDPINDGLDFYESLEGMRVQVNNAVVVGPTTAAGETGNFKLQATQPYVGSSGNLRREIAPRQDANQLAIASMNVENLAPADGASKFDALATQIAVNLASPDIVALMEIQDNDGATNDGTVDASTTLTTLISAIAAAGGPSYAYREIDPVDGQDGGEPGGNIRVAFLFNPARVTFVDRPGGSSTAALTVIDNAGTPELSFSPGRIDPANAAFVNSRKPLAGEFVFNGHTLFVIANHFNSKGGDQPLFGRFQPPALASQVQRVQQAQVVHDFVQSLLALDPDANVVVLGDLNDFEFSAPLGTLKGTILNDLVERLPADQRYTYVFEGNSQVLDHILVSAHLMPGIEYDIVHTNAEFADQASDHDPEVARIALAPAVVEVTSALSVQSTRPVFNRNLQLYTATVRLTNTTNTTIAGPLHVELTGLDPGITLVNANGMHNGAPYIASTASIAPGQTLRIPVRFSNPSRARMRYTVKVYSGAFGSVVLNRVARQRR